MIMAADAPKGIQLEIGHVLFIEMSAIPSFRLLNSTGRRRNQIRLAGLISTAHCAGASGMDALKCQQSANRIGLIGT